MLRFILPLCTRRVQLGCLFFCAILIYLNQLRRTGIEQQCRQVSVLPFIVPTDNDSETWSTLPDLSSLQWPKTPVAAHPAGSVDAHGVLHPVSVSLEPVMSMGQRKLSKRLLKVFSDMMFVNGLGDRFFLAGGTLAGSYLFHDFIPWDDDVDVFVYHRLRGRVQRLLAKLPSPYRWHATKQRDKLFTDTLPKDRNSLDLEMSRRPFRYPWAWPFMDICYYDLNNTHFWEFNLPDLWNKVIIHQSVIFPTTFRPLGKDWYPAPRDTGKFIRLWYGTDVRCVNQGYSHALEKKFKGMELPCQMLLHRYAQVRSKVVRRDSTISGGLSLHFTVVLENLVQHTDFGEVVIHQLCIPMLDGPHD